MADGELAASTLSAEADGLRCWILEHACKYGMDEVIAEIVQMGPELCDVKFSNNNDVSSIFPALLYLRRWRISEDAASISSDGDYLRHAALIFRHIHCKTDAITLKFFVVIYLRLAMLAVLRTMHQNNHEKTLSYINDFFPVWSADFKNNAAEIYKIHSGQHMDKFRRTIGKCRRYVRLLLTNESMRRVYFEQFFKKDVGLFAGSLSKLLAVFFDALSPVRLPLTVIDGLLRTSNNVTSARSAKTREFVDRLRQFGPSPSQVDLEELFLDVLSEMRSTEYEFQNCLPVRPIALAAGQLSTLDSIRTCAGNRDLQHVLNDNSITAPVDVSRGSDGGREADSPENRALESSANMSTPFLTCRSAFSPNHWTQSSHLDLSPRSRNRIALEYEQFVTAETLVLPNVPAAAIPSAHDTAVRRPSPEIAAPSIDAECTAPSSHAGPTVPSNHGAHPAPSNDAEPTVSSIAKSTAPSNDAEPTVPSNHGARPAPSNNAEPTVSSIAKSTAPSNAEVTALPKVVSSDGFGACHAVVGNFNHLPPKKRAFAWIPEGVQPIPTKRRRRLEITLYQVEVIELYGETYEVYA